MDTASPQGFLEMHKKVTKHRKTNILNLSCLSQNLGESEEKGVLKSVLA